MNDVAQFALGMAQALVLGVGQRLTAGASPIDAVEQAAAELLPQVPSFLLAEFKALSPTLLKLITTPTPVESQGIFSTDNAEAKRAAELAASGDALPEN